MGAKGSARIYNNTILSAANGTGIVASGFPSGMIQNNNVSGGATAYIVANTPGATVKNNGAKLSQIGFYLYNSIGVVMTGDYAGTTTAYGAILKCNQRKSAICFAAVKHRGLEHQTASEVRRESRHWTLAATAAAQSATAPG